MIGRGYIESNPSRFLLRYKKENATMKIQDGFVVGQDWHTGKTVMIGIHSILKITLDCGNQPPADRITFIDGHMPHIDLRQEQEQS